MSTSRQTFGAAVTQKFGRLDEVATKIHRLSRVIHRGLLGGLLEEPPTPDHPGKVQESEEYGLLARIDARVRNLERVLRDVQEMLRAVAQEIAPQEMERRDNE